MICHDHTRAKSSNINNDTFNMSKDIIESSTSPDQDHAALATIDAMIVVWSMRDAKIKYDMCGSKGTQSSKKCNDRCDSTHDVKSSTHFSSLTLSG